MNFQSLISLNQQVNALVLHVNSPSSSPVECPDFPVNQRKDLSNARGLSRSSWWSCGEALLWVSDGMWGVMWEQPEKGHPRGRRARSRF